MRRRRSRRKTPQSALCRRKFNGALVQGCKVEIPLCNLRDASESLNAMQAGRLKSDIRSASYAPAIGRRGLCVHRVLKIEVVLQL